VLALGHYTFQTNGLGVGLLECPKNGHTLWNSKIIKLFLKNQDHL
jgi:hypothetical protein